jgi:hypothetical protein
MSEHQLEMRLRAVAQALDTDAPTVDPARLRATTPRRARRWLVAIAVLATVGGMAAAPTAVSALSDLFDVESVPDLGPAPYGVTQPFGGRQTSLAEARHTGEPEAAYVRDDIVGGMISVEYRDGRVRLTQWAMDDVEARAAVVPNSGTAEEITVAGRRALWIEGTARGTFTVTGADLTTHYELFDVAAGALLWHENGVAFLLQGAGAKDDAAPLAAAVR